MAQNNSIEVNGSRRKEGVLQTTPRENISIEDAAFI
jgi:hypothetical protein